MPRTSIRAVVPRHRIVWTRHAEERLAGWRLTRGITRQDVEDVMDAPAQDVEGVAGSRIAQSPFEAGLLRVAYIQHGRQRRVLTLYWTSKFQKYWRRNP